MEELVQGLGSSTPPSCESASKLSIDYLLAGESVKNNAYLTAFSELPWVPRVIKDPRFKKFFNMKGKNLRKELTEAMGVYAALRSSLLRRKGEAEVASVGEKRNCSSIEEDGEGMVLFDMCSGRGKSPPATLLSTLPP